MEILLRRTRACVCVCVGSYDLFNSDTLQSLKLHYLWQRPCSGIIRLKVIAEFSWPRNRKEISEGLRLWEIGRYKQWKSYVYGGLDYEMCQITTKHLILYFYCFIYCMQKSGSIKQTFFLQINLAELEVDSYQAIFNSSALTWILAKSHQLRWSMKCVGNEKKG